MNDAELLMQWRDGNVEAGRQLFGRHYDAVARFFINKVGEEEVPELVQRTFLACLEGAKKRFEGRGSIRGYLFGTAYRMLYKHFEAKRKQRDALRFDVMSITDLGATPSMAIANQQEQRLVLEALRRLPVDYQVVLELHYWEGMTGNAIATALDTPLGTVLTRLRRARDRMRRHLADLATSPAALQSTLQDLDQWARGIRGRVLPDARDSPV